MLKAYLTCVEELYQFPREIIKKEKNVKFDKKYCGLFEKIYEVFGSKLNYILSRIFLKLLLPTK